MEMYFTKQWEVSGLGMMMSSPSSPGREGWWQAMGCNLGSLWRECGGWSRELSFSPSPLIFWLLTGPWEAQCYDSTFGDLNLDIKIIYLSDSGFEIVNIYLKGSLLSGEPCLLICRFYVLRVPVHLPLILLFREFPTCPKMLRRGQELGILPRLSHVGVMNFSWQQKLREF